jgi:hypothetical protein
MKGRGVGRRVFLASIAAHGILIALLTPHILLARGAEPHAARINTSLVATTELPPEPPALPEAPPPPPETPLPERVEEVEPPVEAPAFDPPEHP